MQAGDSSLSEFEVLLAKLEISSKKLNNTSAQCDSFSKLAAQSYVPHAAPVAQPSASLDTAAPSLSASAVPFAPVPQPQSSTTSASLPAAPAASRDTYGANRERQAIPSAQGGHSGDWLEAVEIKNVCPFREVRDVSGNGKSRRLFRLSDPGPYSRVQPHTFSSHVHCQQVYTAEYRLFY